MGDAEVVLHNPLRVQDLLFFLASIILAQILLLLLLFEYTKLNMFRPWKERKSP